MIIPMPLKYEEKGGNVPVPASIEYTEEKSLGAEGYKISVSERGVKVAFGGNRGCIWADVTLKGLAKDGKLPICEIEDKPRFSYRGLSLDVSRHFFKPEEIKKVIDLMSGLKMNALHWHLSDDQGFRIESVKFPGLQAESKDYYTREQIKDIVKYAESKGVEVIPEIDMPGHTRAILAAFPDLSCSKKKVKVGRSGGIYKRILCAGNEDVYKFLEELLTEVTELFPSERFHIGGDEAPKIEWNACPACKAKLAELGLTRMGDLQGYFSVRVAKILKKLGKKPVMWNDALLSVNVPDDVRIQYWTASYNKQVAEFAKSGGEWVFSDMFEVYLDYPYSMTGLKKMHSMPLSLYSAGDFNAHPPIGLEACLWSERVDTNEKLEDRLIPRLFALSEKAWSEGESSYEDFEKRSKALCERLSKDGFTVKPYDQWNPEGEGRLKEAVAFMQVMSGVDFEDEKDELVFSNEEADPEVDNKEFERLYYERFFREEDREFLEKLQSEGAI